MKNVWKGLIVGALTGMVGGSAMDVASGARRKAGAVLGGAVDKAPSVAKAATHKVADVIHDADLPARVHDAVAPASESDAAKKAKTVIAQVAAGFGH